MNNIVQSSAQTKRVDPARVQGSGPLQLYCKICNVLDYQLDYEFLWTATTRSTPFNSKCTTSLFGGRGLDPLEEHSAFPQNPSWIKEWAPRKEQRQGEEGDGDGIGEERGAEGWKTEKSGEGKVE